MVGVLFVNLLVPTNGSTVRTYVPHGHVKSADNGFLNGSSTTGTGDVFIVERIHHLRSLSMFHDPKPL